jgi:hypothetical protein
MSALDSALATIDRIGAEGEMDANAPAPASFDVEALPDPIQLPDGREVYMPTVLGVPLDDIVCGLVDENPAKSRFLRLIGPPGVGKSAVSRALAWRLWRERGRGLDERDGAPFYGFVEIFGGPSSDEYSPFRQEFVPDREDGSQVRLCDSPFVTAMREGHVTLIDEANTIRDSALLSLNSCFDGRAVLTLPSEGTSVTAAPGWFCILAYNPGLVGGSGDIPDAWRSRFPATLEMTSNWAALVRMGAPEPLVAAAARLDQLRIAGDEGLVWTPQFRELESLTVLMRRLDERLAIGFFVSNLHEQVSGGTIQEAEGAAACRMLDEAGYGHLRVGATSKIPNLHGYPRAVAR